MDKSNIIIWEKWRDPLGFDEIEERLSAPKYINDTEEESENQEPSISIKNIKEHFALTPMGLIPLTENTVSGKIFNFWTGHTKFTISTPIVNIIENIDGIETLDVFTRYRFRISVGKAFDDANVLRDVNNSVYNYITKTNE